MNNESDFSEFIYILGVIIIIGLPVVFFDMWLGNMFFGNLDGPNLLVGIILSAFVLLIIALKYIDRDGYFADRAYKKAQERATNKFLKK